MITHAPVVGGTTDYSVIIRVIDSTDGTPETGFAFNTPGINLWYRRGPQGAIVNLTEVTLASVSAAHADGGVVHIGDGYVRVDLPDAAVAAGVPYVAVGGTATGMVVIGAMVPIGPIQTQTTDLTSAALAKFFSVNSGQTQAAAVPGSVVGELASLSATDVATAVRSELTPELDEISDTRTDTAAILAVTDLLAPYVNGSQYLPVDPHKVRFNLSGNTLSVYLPNGTTVNYTKTVSTDPAADPITGVS